VGELLAHGWEVLGVSRRLDCEHQGTDGFHHQRLDLADLELTSVYFTGAFHEIAQLDKRPRVGLVNNAGRLNPVGPLSRVGLRDLDASLRMNAAVPAWLAGHIASEVKGAPCRIVSLSSGAATSAYPGWGAYCASKSALRMADEVLAIELDEFPELAGRDTRVFSYAPGVVATEMQEQIRGIDIADFPRRERFEELHQSGQLVAPEGPAHEIVELLESGAGPRHQALRFQG
jgi:benzil reductase ((S)-benzoin forming)